MWRTTRRLESCPHYHASENLFALCGTCHLTVPKVCVSLGECVNCTDTDLFCVDHCIGGDGRKYCSHFVRLHTEGAHLIHENETFDLFPALGMPGEEPSGSETIPESTPEFSEVEPLVPEGPGINPKRRRKNPDKLATLGGRPSSGRRSMPLMPDRSFESLEHDSPAFSTTNSRKSFTPAVTPDNNFVAILQKAARFAARKLNRNSPPSGQLE